MPWAFSVGRYCFTRNARCPCCCAPFAPSRCYTQEELDDEILNRQAAQARVALVEQTMAKLQGDLKKAQEQLVQARMEV